MEKAQLIDCRKYLSLQHTHHSLGTIQDALLVKTIAAATVLPTIPS